MKKHPHHSLPVRLVCFILLAAASDSPAQENQTQPQTIRVMSYNILYGGEQRGQTLEQTAAVIQAGKADIVGLQEMIGPAPGENEPRPIQAKNLATMLGWYYLDQENNTCGIISRFKITGSTPDKWGAAIELPDGTNMHVFNVHLPSTPYQPYQLLSIPYYNGPFISTAAEAIDYARLARGSQVDAMLAEVKEHAADSDVVFIIGDFNEPSHLDWTDEVAEAGKCPLPVDWPATKAVMNIGFVDAYRAAHPNPLTNPGYTWTPTTDINDPNDRHDRIDFVFARGEGILVTSAIVVGESKTYADVVVTPWPSDHRAVVTEIALPEWSSYPPIVDPQPAGPASLTARDNQTFTVTVTDMDARDVSVQFDWGNGQLSTWSNFAPSGEALSVDHAYPYSGNFSLRVRSRNSENLISDWLFLQEIAVAATPGIRDGLVGLWTFDDPGNIGAATYGSDLTPVGKAPAWIPSQSDWRLQPRTLQNLILTSRGTGNHLHVPHGMGPNGYGQKTNVFSLVFDILAPSPLALWHALYQTTLTNGDDAEYFINPTYGNLGIAALVYSTEPLPRDEWYRVVITANLGEGGFFRTYVNGELFFEHTPPALDSRWALDSDEVLLFADDNHENQSLAVASVAVFSKALSAGEVALLGDPGVDVLQAPGSVPPIPQWVNPATQSTVGEWTPFEVRALDAENHPVQFQVDWGDGRFSDWTDMLSAGESMALSHVWIAEGAHSLRVRARNQTGAQSDWSAAHTITANLAATTKITNGLKVISYNTFAHFGERKRIHETAGWLREQKPDLVALQELSNISEADLATLAQSWGHAHAAVMSETGSTLALTSRFPVENVVRHTSGYHRAILQVRTGGYDVFVVHKSPYNRAERLADMNRIGPVIEALVAAGNSVIVMGDYNAQSEADDAFLSTQTQLLQALPAIHLKDGYFDYDVMNGYLGLGLVDATAQFGEATVTAPTLLRVPHRPESVRAWRSERIDYILTDGTTAANTTLTYPRERLLDFTSDHYPVVAFIADPTHSYYQWKNDFPDLADPQPLSDPDGDGIINLMEFVLGGDPTVPHSTSPQIVRNQGPGAVVYEFRRRADSKNTTWQVVQQSNDLIHWTDHPVPAASEGPFVITLSPDHPHLEQVTLSLQSLSRAQHFFRLWVRWLWE